MLKISLLLNIVNYYTLIAIPLPSFGAMLYSVHFDLVDVEIFCPLRPSMSFAFVLSADKMSGVGQVLSKNRFIRYPEQTCLCSAMVMLIWISVFFSMHDQLPDSHRHSGVASPG